MNTITTIRWARALLALGVIGLGVSWTFFAAWGLKHGPNLGGFWVNALTGDAAGLTWDLIFTAFIVTGLVFRDINVLGRRRVAAVVLVTAILGVCGGLGLYVFFLETRKHSDEPETR